MYFYGLLMILQDGWKITGASNVSSVPDVAVKVEVLVCHFECIVMYFVVG